MTWVSPAGGTPRMEVGAALGLALIGIGLTTSMGIAVWRGWRSTGWRAAPGLIIADGYSTDSYGGDRDLTQGPVVRYAYEVDRVTYHGHRISFARSVPVISQWTAPLWGEVEDPKAGLRAGTTLTVWHHPERPEESVLRPGVDSGFILLLATGIVALATAGLLVASLLPTTG